MELEFEYGSRNITFNLIYRKRKTMSIEVETTGEVTVIAPVGTSTDDVIEKVKSRAGWIVSKQYESKFINDTKIEREAVSGESYMYLGRNYSLDIRVGEDTDNISVKLFQGKFVVNTYTKDEDLIKKAMENWYREKTLAKVKERVSYYSSYFNDKVTTIKVKEQKKRWASCTSKNELLFNWRCVMAPVFVLDYIVVHEMCHMEYKNHSKDFWNRVCAVMPDYEVRRAWLRNNGIKMDI